MTDQLGGLTSSPKKRAVEQRFCNSFIRVPCCFVLSHLMLNYQEKLAHASFLVLFNSGRCYRIG
jgi:hypothetical protein